MKKAFSTLSVILLFLQIVTAEGVEPVDSDMNGKREVSSLDHLLWITTNVEALAYDYE